MNILLIEDNEGDIALFTESLEINNLSYNLKVCLDGADALETIRLMGTHPSENAIPDIIILDINLPKLNGRDLLKEISTYEYLKDTPKIILSTSDLSSDITFCYEHGANSFITKPNDIFEFFDIIKSVLKFWINTACVSSLFQVA